MKIVFAGIFCAAAAVLLAAAFVTTSLQHVEDANKPHPNHVAQKWLLPRSAAVPVTAETAVTAPLLPGRVIRAKIEAVLLAIAAVLALPMVPIAIASLRAALITIAGAAISAVSATAIQLWFRAQAKIASR